MTAACATPGVACPHCAASCELQVSGGGHVIPPAPGQFSLCVECGGLSRVGDDLTLQAISGAAMPALDPAVLRHIEAARAAWETTRSGKAGTAHAPEGVVMLLLGDPEYARVREIIAYAENHVWQPGCDARVPGDDPARTMVLPLDFHVIFSFSVLPDVDPSLCRHLSVWHDRCGARFPLTFLRHILRAFGFSGDRNALAWNVHRGRLVLAEPVTPTPLLAPRRGFPHGPAS